MLRQMYLVSPQLYQKHCTPPYYATKGDTYKKMVNIRKEKDPALRETARVHLRSVEKKEMVPGSAPAPGPRPRLRPRPRPRRRPRPRPPLQLSLTPKPKAHRQLVYETPTRAGMKKTEEEFVYQPTPKTKAAPTHEEEDDDEKEEYEVPSSEIKSIAEYGRDLVGELASPYIAPYYHKRRYLDQMFGIRLEDNGTFQIGNSQIEVDGDSNIILHGKVFKGTAGLWELLTRKKG